MVKLLSILLGLACACCCCSHGPVSAEELCSIVPASYAGAKTTYPHLATAIETIEQYSITAWYTDRLTPTEQSSMLASLMSKCSEDSRMTIAVYGIPNKDCNAGLSSSGSVKSTSDYQSFLTGLTTAVGNRKVLYVVEPDAVGLLAEEGGCGKSAGYLENLKIAIAALSANANAQLYLDVGYWLLADSTKATEVATVVKEVSGSGAVKGITINTSNYRPTDECTNHCTSFQTAMGSTDMSCIIDTSRNYNKLATPDWCNVKSAGIGKPPTSNTGIPNVDYFMWVKPPGESDGVCTDTAHSGESLSGVTAGAFYLDAFQALWDQGYFVSEQSMATISTSSGNSTSQTNSEQHLVTGNKTDTQTGGQTGGLSGGSADQSDSVGDEYKNTTQSAPGAAVPVYTMTAISPSTYPTVAASITAPTTNSTGNTTASAVDAAASTATPSVPTTPLPATTSNSVPQLSVACKGKRHLNKL